MVFPAPRNPSGASAVQVALSSATDAIHAALVNTTAYGQLDPNATSFSIDVYSTHENSSIFTYHYSAPALARPSEGVAKVDSNTVYRVGSVSKLLTVYTYLAAVGDVSFNEPVTKYIPELAAYAKQNASALNTGDIDLVDWNDVTVGSLASHLAGIARDFAPNIASEASLVQVFGSVPDVKGNFCGNPAQGHLPCNRSGKSIFMLLLDIPSILPLIMRSNVPLMRCTLRHDQTSLQTSLMSIPRLLLLPHRYIPIWHSKYLHTSWRL